MVKEIIVAVVVLIFLAGCSQERKGFSVAEQYGLAYAPVTIMKEKGFLKDRLPDVEIEWKQMANTSAIREAMVAKDLDIGFMALPPFFIGADKGMEWKIISGLSEVPLGLVSLNERILTLPDFNESDRIVLPQPGSIQHILLSMAAERELGDARYFDNRIVTMTHPDGMQALLANSDIAGHFTSPPYLFMEMENSAAHIVLTGEEAMGEPFTFIVGVTTDEFSERKPEWEVAFREALADAMVFVEKNPDESSKILADAYGIEEKAVFDYLTRDGMVFASEIKGMKTFHDFMVREGYIEDLGEMEGLKRGVGFEAD